MGITFRNVSSESIGLKVGTYPEYEMPKRNYEKIHILGRNGDLIFDDGDYDNVERTYKDVSIVDLTNGYQTAVNAFIAWLNSGSGYGRLEDTYDSTHYRLAIPSDLGSIENIYNLAGRFDLKFDCMPQRYLKSGANSQIITSGGVITNPTIYNAKPLIVLTLNYNAKDDHTGYFRIQSGSVTNTVTISMPSSESNLTSLTIDCESMDCYNGAYNKNSLVSMTNDDFPVLYSGSNIISFGDCVTACRITPNWWEI